MSELKKQVEKFHRVFGHPTQEVPNIPADERVRFRARFIVEEVFEFLEACFPKAVQLRYAHAMVRQDLFDTPVEVNLPEAVDALADIDYVVEGTRLEFGVDGAPIAREVHRSNMAKVFPDGTVRKTPDGKTAKPEGWTPPDIARCLREQGWK